MNNMKKHFEVVAALIFDGERIFSCQRNEKGECAFKWEFPGGKIEPGETKEHALVREIKEELNGDIEVISYINTVSYEYNTFSITMHNYQCKAYSKLTLKEHINYKWLTIDEMREYDFAEADKLIIKHLSHIHYLFI
jgi:8-oxo-dGTP diphosphatase